MLRAPKKLQTSDALQLPEQFLAGSQPGVVLAHWTLQRERLAPTSGFPSAPGFQADTRPTVRAKFATTVTNSSGSRGFGTWA